VPPSNLQDYLKQAPQPLPNISTQDAKVPKIEDFFNDNSSIINTEDMSPGEQAISTAITGASTEIPQLLAKQKQDKLTALYSLSQIGELKNQGKQVDVGEELKPYLTDSFTGDYFQQAQNLGIESIKYGLGSGALRLKGKDIFRTYQKDGKTELETLPLGYLDEDGEYRPYNYTKNVSPKEVWGEKGMPATNVVPITPEEFPTLARKQTEKDIENQGWLGGFLNKAFQDPVKKDFLEPLSQILTGKVTRSASDFVGKEGGSYESGKSWGDEANSFATAIVGFGVVSGVLGAGAIVPYIGVTSTLTNTAKYKTGQQSLMDAVYNIGMETATMAALGPEMRVFDKYLLNPALTKAIARDSKSAFALPLAAWVGTIWGVSAINTAVNMAGSQISNLIQGRDVAKNMFDGFVGSWVHGSLNFLAFDLFGSTHRWEQGANALALRKELRSSIKGENAIDAFNYANYYTTTENKNAITDRLAESGFLETTEQSNKFLDYLDNIVEINNKLSSIMGRPVSVVLDKNLKPYLQTRSEDPIKDREVYSGIKAGNIDKNNQEQAQEVGVPQETLVQAEEISQMVTGEKPTNAEKLPRLENEDTDQYNNRVTRYYNDTYKEIQGQTTLVNSLREKGDTPRDIVNKMVEKHNTLAEPIAQPISKEQIPQIIEVLKNDFLAQKEQVKIQKQQELEAKKQEQQAKNEQNSWIVSKLGYKENPDTKIQDIIDSKIDLINNLNPIKDAAKVKGLGKDVDNLTELSKQGTTLGEIYQSDADARQKIKDNYSQMTPEQKRQMYEENRKAAEQALKNQPKEEKQGKATDEQANKITQKGATPDVQGKTEDQKTKDELDEQSAILNEGVDKVLNEVKVEPKQDLRTEPPPPKETGGEKPISKPDVERDTYLTEGIAHVKKNIGEIGNQLLKMAYTKGVIDNKKLNEFGKELLNAKDISDVSATIEKYSDKKTQEEEVYNLLSDKPIHIKDIAKKLGVSDAEAVSRLLNLEYENKIKQLPGKYYVKSEEKPVEKVEAKPAKEETVNTLPVTKESINSFKIKNIEYRVKDNTGKEPTFEKKVGKGKNAKWEEVNKRGSEQKQALLKYGTLNQTAKTLTVKSTTSENTPEVPKMVEKISEKQTAEKEVTPDIIDKTIKNKLLSLSDYQKTKYLKSIPYHELTKQEYEDIYVTSMDNHLYYVLGALDKGLPIPERALTSYPWLKENINNIQKSKDNDFYYKKGDEYVKVSKTESIKLIPGMETFIYYDKNNKLYKIIDAKSGAMWVQGKSKDEAINHAKITIEKHGIPYIQNLSDSAIKKYGVTPRYEYSKSSKTTPPSTTTSENKGSSGTASEGNGEYTSADLNKLRKYEQYPIAKLVNKYTELIDKSGINHLYNVEQDKNYNNVEFTKDGIRIKVKNIDNAEILLHEYAHTIFNPLYNLWENNAKSLTAKNKNIIDYIESVRKGLINKLGYNEKEIESYNLENIKTKEDLTKTLLQQKEFATSIHTGRLYDLIRDAKIGSPNLILEKLINKVLELEPQKYKLNKSNNYVSIDVASGQSRDSGTTSENKGSSGTYTEAEPTFTQGVTEEKTKEFKGWFGDWEKGNLEKYKTTKYWDNKLSPKENALKLAKLDILPKETRELLSKLYKQIPDNLKENKKISLNKLNPFAKSGIVRYSDKGMIIEKGKSLATTIHELTHTATLEKIWNQKEISQEELIALKEINNLREYSLKYLKDNKNLITSTQISDIYYGFKDTEEFLSELTSNAKFRNLLRTIPMEIVEGQKRGILNSIYNSIIEPFRRLLNLNKIEANNVLKASWDYLDKYVGKSKEVNGTTSKAEPTFTDAGKPTQEEKDKFENEVVFKGKLHYLTVKLNEALQRFIQSPRGSERGQKAQQDHTDIYNRMQEIKADWLTEIGVIGKDHVKSDQVHQYYPAALEKATKKNLTTSKGESVTTAGGEEIKTKEFKDFFGDWEGKDKTNVSKVVDKEGKPLVVYHGTGKIFDEFKKTTPRLGFYFTKDPNIANAYTDKIGYGLIDVDPSNIIPVYLDIKNPKIIDINKGLGSKKHFTELAEQAKEEGYDGMILKNVIDPIIKNRLFSKEQKWDVKKQDQYVAFDPAQIKSVFNTGTWSKENPNISYAQKREETIKVNGEDVKVKPLAEGTDVVNGFYSELENQLRGSKNDKQVGSRWLTELSTKGVKGEELAWTGVKDMLESNKGKVFTKQELLDWIKKPENRVEVVEKMQQKINPKEQKELENELRDIKGKRAELAEQIKKVKKDSPEYYDIFWKDDKLVNRLNEIQSKMSVDNQFDTTQYGREQSLNLEGDFISRKEILILNPKGDFQDPHFNERGLIAHLRLDIRKGKDGKTEMLLNEVQGDWGQKGKKEGFQSKEDKNELNQSRQNLYNKNKRLDEISDEIVKQKESWNIDSVGRRFPSEEQKNIYHKSLKEADDLYGEIDKIEKRIYQLNDKEVSPAPFVTKTQDWVKLGLKTAIKDAVKEGVDRIVWTSGEQQNERYDLSKQINEIRYEKSEGSRGEQSYDIMVLGKDNQVIYNTPTKESKLEGLVGKEMAKKIVNGEGNDEYFDNEPTIKTGKKIFRGLDLKVGGKPMLDFYGTPDEKAGIVGDVAKGLGATVKTFDTENGKMSGFEITPQMKAEVERGLPMFAPKTEGKNIPINYDDPVSTLQELASNETDPTLKKLYQGIVDINNANLKDKDWTIEVQQTPWADKYAAQVGTDGALLSLDKSMPAEIFGHEMGHAAIKFMINKFLIDPKLVTEKYRTILSDADLTRKTLIKKFGATDKSLEIGGEHYFLSNLHEFFASLPEPDVRAKLEAIKINPNYNYFQKAWNYAKKLLGFKPSETQYDDLISKMLKIRDLKTFGEEVLTRDINSDIVKGKRNPVISEYVNTLLNPDVSYRKKDEDYSIFKETEKQHRLNNITTNKGIFLGRLDKYTAPVFKAIQEAYTKGMYLGGEVIQLVSDATKEMKLKKEEYALLGWTNQVLRTLKQNNKITPEQLNDLAYVTSTMKDIYEANKDILKIKPNIEALASVYQGKWRETIDKVNLAQQEAYILRKTGYSIKEARNKIEQLQNSIDEKNQTISLAQIDRRNIIAKIKRAKDRLAVLKDRGVDLTVQRAKIKEIKAEQKEFNKNINELKDAQYSSDNLQLRNLKSYIDIVDQSPGNHYMSIQGVRQGNYVAKTSEYELKDGKYEPVTGVGDNTYYETYKTPELREKGLKEWLKARNAVEKDGYFQIDELTANTHKPTGRKVYIKTELGDLRQAKYFAMRNQTNVQNAIERLTGLNKITGDAFKKEYKGLLSVMEEMRNTLNSDNPNDTESIDYKGGMIEGQKGLEDLRVKVEGKLQEFSLDKIAENPKLIDAVVKNALDRMLNSFVKKDGYNAKNWGIHGWQPKTHSEVLDFADNILRRQPERIREMWVQGTMTKELKKAREYGQEVGADEFVNKINGFMDRITNTTGMPDPGNANWDKYWNKVEKTSHYVQRALIFNALAMNLKSTVANYLESFVRMPTNLIAQGYSIPDIAKAWYHTLPLINKELIKTASYNMGHIESLVNFYKDPYNTEHLKGIIKDEELRNLVNESMSKMLTGRLLSGRPTQHLEATWGKVMNFLYGSVSIPEMVNRIQNASVTMLTEVMKNGLDYKIDPSLKGNARIQAIEDAQLKLMNRAMTNIGQSEGFYDVFAKGSNMQKWSHNSMFGLLTNLQQPAIVNYHNYFRIADQILHGATDINGVEIPHARAKALLATGLRFGLLTTIFGAKGDDILGGIKSILDFIAGTGLTNGEFFNLNDKEERLIYDLAKSSGWSDETAKKFTTALMRSPLAAATTIDMSRDNTPLNMLEPLIVSSVAQTVNEFNSLLKHTFGGENILNDIETIMFNHTNAQLSRWVKAVIQGSEGKELNKGVPSGREYTTVDMIRDMMFPGLDVERTMRQQKQWSQQTPLTNLDEEVNAMQRIYGSDGFKFKDPSKPKLTFNKEKVINELANELKKGEFRDFVYRVNDDYINAYKPLDNQVGLFEKSLAKNENLILDRLAKGTALRSGESINKEKFTTTSNEYKAKKTEFMKNIGDYIKADVIVAEFNKTSSKYRMENTFDNDMQLDPEEINQSVEMKPEPIKNLGTKEERALAYAEYKLYVYLYGKPKKEKKHGNRF
jgi:hypothetical protein